MEAEPIICKLLLSYETKTTDVEFIDNQRFYPIVNPEKKHLKLDVLEILKHPGKRPSDFCSSAV